MDITFSALQYIVEIAKTKSISKAAKNCYLSQPHLSNTVRSVEREFGIILFQRSSKGMELTESGAHFVEQASQILMQVDLLTESINIDLVESTKINISLTRSYQVLRAITEFINLNSDKKRFEMNVREGNPFQVIEDVRSGASQLGVLHFYDTQEQYFFHCLKAYGLAFDSHYKRAFLVAMSIDNPLSKVAHIKSDMLSDEIIVLYGNYESEMVPYRFAESNRCVSSKYIHVYERSTAMDILSRCHNTYTFITGLHPVFYYLLAPHVLALVR